MIQLPKMRGVTFRHHPDVKGNDGSTIQVMVRYKGHAVAQSFDAPRTDRDDFAGLAWALTVKAAIDRDGPDFDKEKFLAKSRQKKTAAEKSTESPGVNTDPSPNVGWTLRHALDCYIADVLYESKTEKAWNEKSNRLKSWSKLPLAEARLDKVSREDIRTYIKNRQTGPNAVKASTIRNDAFCLSAFFVYAIRPVDSDKGGWGLAIKNPCYELGLPPPAHHRDRRLEPDQMIGDTAETLHFKGAHIDIEDSEGNWLRIALGERKRLRDALADGPDGDVMACLFDIAIWTGMRQAEILDIRLGQIQMDGKTTIIKRPDSKNGHPRKVTASNTVETALQTLIDNLPEDVGPDTKLISLNQDKLAWRWKQARKKAGVKDLTWHDLRHEALSILANSGANIGMLQTQSGHRSAKTLIKYINPTPREIKKILDGISES